MRLTEFSLDFEATSPRKSLIFFRKLLIFEF